MAGPQLSILIPYLGDEPSLEATLLSVLENRPPRCEILIAHNGSYRDPYLLGDEVRFVIEPRSSTPIRNLQQGIAAAQGGVIHILQPGVTVLGGWCEEPQRILRERSVGSVASLIRNRADDDQLVSAGWTTADSELWRPIGAGESSVGGAEQALVHGACLAAGFYRASLLRDISAGLALPSLAVAQMHWGLQLAELGWSCRIAERSHTRATSAIGWPTLDGATLHGLQCVRAAHENSPAPRDVLVCGLRLLMARPWSVPRWGQVWMRWHAARGGHRLTAALRASQQNVQQRVAVSRVLAAA